MHANYVVMLFIKYTKIECITKHSSNTTDVSNEMRLCFSRKMTKIEHLYLWLFLQVDEAEEPEKTGGNKAPSKFQSVGVQVEEEKW